MVLGFSLALALWWPNLAAAQSGGQITGLVTDQETGRPVSGAQVFIEGTRLQGQTQENGRYLLLNVPVGVYTVTVRMVGFADARQENVRVGANAPATVDFALRTTVLTLEEIVVTGVADPTSGLKTPVTVAKVTATDMPVPTNSSAAGAIQGKVAGAQILRAGGPGAGVYIQLRTPTSLHGSNSPMFVVDGVILSQSFSGTTADIEALDIESIEVIKGAAAASMYGSRANNGVISITTKRGGDIQQGATRVTVRSEYGLNQIGRVIPISRHHYYKVDGEGYYINAAGDRVERTERIINDRRMMDEPYGPYPTYDHVKTFFNPGAFMGNTVSLGQNSASTNFLVTFNNYKETGVLPNNKGYSRNNLRINLDHRLRQDLNVGVTAYHMRSFEDVISGSPFSDLNRYRIDVDLGQKDENGKWLMLPDPLSSNVNPLYRQITRNNWNKRTRSQASTSVRYRPLYWLSIDGNVGYDRSDRLYQHYLARGTLIAADDESTGVYQLQEGLTDSYTGTLTATILNTWGDLTARSYIRGVMERDENQTFSQTGSDFAVLGVKDMNIARTQQISSSLTERRANGLMVATALNYADKYIGDFLIRRDGSSLFGADERWATYYRAAGAYRMALEPWWPIPALSEFKVSYSIGTAGGRPGFSDQYETFSVDAAAGRVYKRAFGNRDLKPEHTTEKELSLTAIYDNRISLILSHVYTYTTNQIIGVSLPAAYGYNTQSRNAGTIDGTTYEATLEAQLLNRRDFGWRTNLVLDRRRHKVVEYDRPCYRDGLTMFCTGMIMGEFYGRKFHGSHETLPEAHAGSHDQFQVNDDGYLVPVGAGNSWKDGLEKGLWGTTVNIDGVNYAWGRPFIIDLGDGVNRMKIGDGNPDLNFGWSNNFRWKRFSLYALLNGQIGGDIYNSAKHTQYGRYDHIDVDQSSKPKERKKTLDYYTSVYDGGNFNAAFVESGTYAKLSEVSLSYRLRNVDFAALSRLGVDQMQVSLLGRNLYTFTNYSGYDPEVGSNFNRNDNFPYPKYRTITASVQLTF